MTRADLFPSDRAQNPQPPDEGHTDAAARGAPARLPDSRDPLMHYESRPFEHPLDRVGEL
jgi:hypothetical protein